MTMHTFKMTEAQAELIFAQVQDHTAALKNWMANAVERGELTKAQDLVKDLRHYQDIARAFNMQAKRDIANYRGIEIETDHLV